MNILLLGATGFLGKAFLQSRPATDRVICLTRSPLEFEVPCDVTFVKGDISDGASLQAALKTVEETIPDRAIDSLVNLAVSRLHRTFPQTALDMFFVNTATTAMLLDFAHRNQIGHVVLGSTGSVYNNSWGHQSKEEEFTFPKSYFAASKQFADAFASFYADKIDISVLRFFVPFGPDLADRMLNNIIDRVEAGNTVDIAKDGRALTFSPIFAGDAIEVVNRAISERWNDVVNVSNGEEIGLDTVAQMAAVHLKKEANIARVSDGEPPYLVPNISKLRSMMPDHEFMSFEHGFKMLLQTQKP